MASDGGNQLLDVEVLCEVVELLGGKVSGGRELDGTVRDDLVLSLDVLAETSHVLLPVSFRLRLSILVRLHHLTQRFAVPFPPLLGAL